MAARTASPPPLSIGPLTIVPELRELVGPDGRCTLEPRVLSVLLELAVADGRPVSRDALVERCWGGVAISEDALNRAVAKLRHNLRSVAGDVVHLITIKSLGYRLQVTQRVAPSASAIAPAFDLEQRALGAMFEGTADGIGTAVHYLTRAVEEQPENGPLWGSLAMARVLSLPFAGTGKAGVAAHAREAAERAQMLLPNEGRSLAALASLRPTYGHWQEKHTQLTTFEQRAPAGTAPLIFQRVLFWAAAGRMNDALELLDRLIAAAPLVPWIQSAHAHTLAATGSFSQALDSAERSLRRWPGHRLTALTRLHLLLTAGQVAPAADLVRSDAYAAAVQPQLHALTNTLIEALAAPSKVATADCLARHMAAVTVTPELIEHAILAAAHLGAVDTALSLLQSLYADDNFANADSVAFPKIGFMHPHERSTALLFLAPMKAVRDSSGFNAVLVRTELPAFAI